MDAHLRYNSTQPEQYEKPTIVSRLIGKKSMSVIEPFLSNLKGKTIIEVGCGTGLYTKHICDKNRVICVDLYPHLFNIPKVTIIKGSCTELHNLTDAELNPSYIAGIWMTEYLSPGEILAFFESAKKVLSTDGRLVLTFVSKGFWGKCYIFGARLKGLKKFNYSGAAVELLCKKTGFIIEKSESVGRFGLEYGKFYVLRKIQSQ